MFLSKLSTLKVKLSILLVVFCLGFAPAMTAPTPAAAQDESPFAGMVAKGLDLFKHTRNVVFVIGGFGLIGLAGFAIFGEIEWKWFGALALGLMIVGVAGALVQFVTGTTDDPDIYGGAGFEDTLDPNQ